VAHERSAREGTETERPSSNGTGHHVNGRMPPPVRAPVRRFELEGIRPAARTGLALAVLIPVAIVVWLVLGTRRVEIADVTDPRRRVHDDAKDEAPRCGRPSP
jgi:hypothetical protein